MTNKIKSLRSQYAREKAKYVAKARRSGSGLDDVIQIKWTHFKALKFLDSAINARSSKSNIEALVRFFIHSLFVKLSSIAMVLQNLCCNKRSRVHPLYSWLNPTLFHEPAVEI